MQDKINGLEYFVIIAEQKNKDEFLALLGEHGSHGIETVYGRGSMSPSALAAAFGLETEQGSQLKYLKPGQEPVATFALTPGDKVVAAYEYCTLHGLWKA